MNNENIPQPLAEIPIGPSNFEQFLDRNQKSLIVLAILVVLIGAGVIVYKGLRDSAEAAAGAALTLTYDEVARRYDVEALEAVRMEHAGTRAADTATYLMGGALWDDNKKEEAIVALQYYIDNYSGDMRDKALTELASRYQQLGDNEKALEAYRKVITSGNKVYIPFALLSMGDIFRASGEVEKAEQAYKEAVTRYPESVLAYSSKGGQRPPSPAERRLELLGVQDPTMVAKLPELNPPGALMGGAMGGGINAPIRPLSSIIDNAPASNGSDANEAANESEKAPLPSQPETDKDTEK